MGALFGGVKPSFELSEEMVRLQDTSTNLQTSLATGLEKYANATDYSGEEKKKQGEQGRQCLFNMMLIPFLLSVASASDEKIAFLCTNMK